MHQVVNESLQGKQYNSEEVAEWIQSITNGIKTKLKGI